MGFASDITNKYTDLLVSPCLTDLTVKQRRNCVAHCLALPEAQYLPEISSHGQYTVKLNAPVFVNKLFNFTS